jgi:thioredoxin-related protein
MKALIHLLILCALFWQLTVFAEPPEGYPFLPFDKAMIQAKTQQKPIFVYFGRYGCGYCDKTNKESFSDKTVFQTYTKNYVLAYIDSESGKRLRLPSGERITEREVGTRYKAFVTPVFSYLNPEGKHLHRLVGVQRIDDLLTADQTVQRVLTRND